MNFTLLLKHEKLEFYKIGSFLPTNVLVRSLLPGGAGYAEPLPGTGPDEEEREPDVSLITGRLRRDGREAAAAAGAGQLALINDRTVSVLHQGGGGEFLASRYRYWFSSLRMPQTEKFFFTFLTNIPVVRE